MPDTNKKLNTAQKRELLYGVLFSLSNNTDFSSALSDYNQKLASPASPYSGFPDISVYVDIFITKTALHATYRRLDETCEIGADTKNTMAYLLGGMHIGLPAMAYFGLQDADMLYGGSKLAALSEKRKAYYNYERSVTALISAEIANAQSDGNTLVIQSLSDAEKIFGIRQPSDITRKVFGTAFLESFHDNDKTCQCFTTDVRSVSAIDSLAVFDGINPIARKKAKP